MRTFFVLGTKTILRGYQICVSIWGSSVQVECVRLVAGGGRAVHCRNQARQIYMFTNVWLYYCQTCQHLNRLFSFGGCLPCQCQCGWWLEELGAVAGGGGSVSRDNCWRWLLAAAGLWLASSDQWPSATWPGHQSSSSSHQPQQQVTPHRQHQQHHQHQHQHQQWIWLHKYYGNFHVSARSTCHSIK